MKRRGFLIATGALATAPIARGQKERVRRVGVILPSSTNQPLLPPLLKRLRELGWSEGRNLALEVRNAENRYERFPALAAELAMLKVDAMVTASTPAALAAKEASASIPVVFTWVSDPVKSGLVASLGRPGGNATGLSNVASDILPKQMELLRLLLPNLDRIAALTDPKFVSPLSGDFKDAAARAGLPLVLVEANSAEELEAAFLAAARAGARALVVPPIPLYGAQRERIGALGLKHRIAVAGQYRQFAAAGALLSFGSDLLDGFVRCASYVDRILRGAKPADLPVEQADKFETVINRKTAAALGITIPPAVLARADEVIE